MSGFDRQFRDEHDGISMSISVGVGLPNVVRDVAPSVIPRWAIAAEQAAFSSVASFGRFGYPGVSDTVALTAAAAVTTTIGLMSTVLVAPAWPPALLAKEVAGIAGLAEGRLTLGIGVGLRPDDFPVAGMGLSGRGARLDQALPTLRDTWAGVPLADGQNPVVPQPTPDIPLLFGATSPPAMARMATWGRGYIGPSLPVEAVEHFFDDARAAWRATGRDGEPHLVGIAYYGLTDPDGAREYVRDFYSATPAFVDTVVSGVVTTPEQVRALRSRYADIGADELIFCPTSSEVEEVARLADTLG
jgi:alkanesulfonate monooxygenase SsuD/methylene tetrahydromethanopterin reductase-like flavin-dependent oxidoreductase (luciferase family)